MKPEQKHTHNEELCEIVARAIAPEISLGLYRSMDNYPLFHFTPDLKLSVNLESRVLASGYIDARRLWTSATVKVSGVFVVLRFPRRLTDQGMSFDDDLAVDSTESLVAHIHAHRPRKPLPIAFDNPKLPVVFVSRDMMYLDGGSDDAEWTTPARPVAALNTALKRWGLRLMTTDEGNAMLSAIDELLAQHTPSVRWIDDMTPSELYTTDRCDKYSSCMKGCNPEWFQIYDDFHSEGKLRMIGIYMGTERVGRALCWIGENPADSYLDRVYAPGHRCTFDPAVVRELKKFCAAEGIDKTVFPQSAEHFDLHMVSKFRIRVPGGNDPNHYERFPYCDSMYYFGWDGWLHNYPPRGTTPVILHNTDGSAEGVGDGDDDEDYVTLYNGDRVPEDEATYVERFSEYYPSHRCSYSSYLDESVLDSDSVETYDGHLIWSDGAVTLHDGEYAERGGPGLVELSDGDYAVRDRDEIITLHDGTVVLDDGDLDWTTTNNGECAMREDCVEVDGVWYLHGDEPATEEETENA